MNKAQERSSGSRRLVIRILCQSGEVGRAEARPLPAEKSSGELVITVGLEPFSDIS